MGGYVEVTVFLACTSFVFYSYAIIYIIRGFLESMLFFFIVPSVLFGLILRFRIPRPKPSKVYHILGSDWGAYEIFSKQKKHENDYVMKVVGHRACGLDAPENSLSALKKVVSNGLTAVEFDVMLTADNIPIVFHDDTTTRLSGVTKIVEKSKWDELKTLDISVKHPFGENFPKERIATLEEYVTFCITNQIRMMIDLKTDDMNMVKAINDLYHQYPALYDLALVTSFNAFLIYKIRSRDPEIVCCLAWRPYYYSHGDYNGFDGALEPRSDNYFRQALHRMENHIHYWILWNFGYYILGMSAILLHNDIVTKKIVQYWCKRDVRVIAWTVNLPTAKQYFEKCLQITYLTDTLINS